MNDGCRCIMRACSRLGSQDTSMGLDASGSTSSASGTPDMPMGSEATGSTLPDSRPPVVDPS